MLKLSEIMSISPKMVQLFGAVFVVLWVTVFMQQSQISLNLVWKTAIIAAGIIVIFWIIQYLPRVMATLLAWVLFVFAMLYMGTFTVQFMTQNRFDPPFTRAACFFAPAQYSCPLGPSPEDRYSFAPAAADQQVASVRRRALRMSSHLAALPNGEPNRVYIQFPSPDQRDLIAGIATTLAGNGWNIPDAELGGEQLESAFGLNEVRFFHAEDKALAEAMAQQFAAEANWIEELDVVNLSDKGYKVDRGLIEIWVSPATRN